MLFGRQSRHVKRILIVEDEPLVAFDNEVMVEGAGYKVVATTDNVGDALAVIAREQKSADGEGGIDLVLTDITLTGHRSGRDLAVECRKLGLPVLFATATPPEQAEELAVGVLMKPYNERRLKAALKAVEQVLSGKSKVRQPEGMILYPGSLAA
ncbi:hypothetical protein GCM10022280_07270 [Sphingomonas swuensis]|uniref:Response regulatory domain-containing protein n=1 Tax=Sphingomonas swuensis TaxID=977800 RepID=A0ABP7SI93_9SPHN